ncbi:hypothetical protein B0H13DRAFT_2301678 [Mycena leptocephala]|nr:hypothetical protein B0H13DRAFT_2301678 [Mycena leptocephala]
MLSEKKEALYQYQVAQCWNCSNTQVQQPIGVQIFSPSETASEPFRHGSAAAHLRLEALLDSPLATLTLICLAGFMQACLRASAAPHTSHHDPDTDTIFFAGPASTLAMYAEAMTRTASDPVAVIATDKPVLTPVTDEQSTAALVCWNGSDTLSLGTGTAALLFH